MYLLFRKYIMVIAINNSEILLFFYYYLLTSVNLGHWVGF